jgi:hypothetical protein
MGSSFSSPTSRPRPGRFWSEEVIGQCPFCDPGPGYDTEVCVRSSWDAPDDDDAEVWVNHAPRPEYHYLDTITCPGVPKSWSARQVVEKFGDYTLHRFDDWVRESSK